MHGKLIRELASGKHLAPDTILDGLEPVFPLIRRMSETPQDSIWHAEGNVRVHTSMVLDETFKLIDTHELADSLTDSDKLALVLSAALHDIGKVLTTREQEIEGRTRITSPRHAMVGRSYVAPRLFDLDLPQPTREKILACIGHHHDPRKLLAQDTPTAGYWRLGRTVDVRLVYLLEIADTRGRNCLESDDDGLEMVELFRLACEDAGIWGTDDPYNLWHSEITKQLHISCDEKSIDFVFRECRRQFEAGSISTPSEAIARTYEHRDQVHELVVLCGPSGTGKSTWIATHLNGHVHISLDEIREEITGRRDRMNKEGQVLQLARKRLRECLGKKRDVVWDATNLRSDERAALLSMGHDYHALSKIVVMAVSPATAIARNAQRDHAVPTSVIDKQFRRMEWPNVWEAHQCELGVNSA